MQYCAQRRATTDLPTPPFSPPMKWIVLMAGSVLAPCPPSSSEKCFNSEETSAGRRGRGHVSLGQPERLEPLGRRRDQLARAKIKQADGEHGVAAEVAVRVVDLLRHPPDLPAVRLHPGLDGDPLAVAQLALKLQRDLENRRADPPADHFVEAVAVAGDEIPARLLQDLEVLGVVDVSEGVEVLLADEERILVCGAEHAKPPAQSLTPAWRSAARNAARVRPPGTWCSPAKWPPRFRSVSTRRRRRTPPAGWSLFRPCSPSA